MLFGADQSRETRCERNGDQEAGEQLSGWEKNTEFAQQVGEVTIAILAVGIEGGHEVSICRSVGADLSAIGFTTRLGSPLKRLPQSRCWCWWLQAYRVWGVRSRGSGRGRRFCRLRRLWRCCTSRER